MRFSGSAMRVPHENGMFRTRLYHPVNQCFVQPEGISAAEAAGAEPLAVCLHALTKAPDLKDKRVLITGAGPIGAICTALARARGATEIVVTDVQDFTLEIARKLGADRVVNVSRNTEGLNDFATGKGQVDVVLECSANRHAISQAVSVCRPQATFVQIGVGGNTPLPLNQIVAKEITLVGTHRFDKEFELAARMIGASEIDLSPIVTQVVSAKDAVRAFELAGDRTQAVKVQLDFEG
jgi:L-idonate 5-dehydrogenase